ncbi:hypothetical protein [Psychroserpens luteolus]|uniref:hypothetical protein n=1 Tax=Psychroserpens luteolus TaxID=2855840 RepID=UPI001E4C418A|nr:hypothetical protein [Psychroserpens luteolus]MCD2258936.1 hypothetical protein [Psychroserpens luteolus]
MKKIISFLCILTVQWSFSQVGNDKKIIAKNQLKSSFEKHCFTGSNSGCTSFFKAYDRRGNVIEWNMGRIGTFYRSTYDKNDNKIALQWIDKIDTTDVTLFKYAYDKYGNLIKDEDGVYKNDYDKRGNLIQITSETKNGTNAIKRKTVLQVWSDFNKLLSKTTKIEIISESSQPTLKDLYVKTYKYDGNQNLIKELHFSNYQVKNTITYSYDNSNRLIEKIEINPSRLEQLNNMTFGHRAPLTAITTRMSYNTNGSIKEKYTYFSDPCMSLDNHFLYKHHYLDNGLLSQVDVYENDEQRFSISYDYEYFNK